MRHNNLLEILSKPEITAVCHIEVETKVILSNCQYLESIRVWCDGEYLNKKDFLEILVKHLSKKF